MKHPLTLLLLLTALCFACNKAENLEPAGTLTGSYSAIVDPIRCAMPTTQALSISMSGGDYTISYDYFGKSGYRFKNVSTQIKDGEIQLMYKGEVLGKYVKDTYRFWDGQQFAEKHDYVLYLMYNKNNEHIEFMGGK